MLVPVKRILVTASIALLLISCSGTDDGGTTPDGQTGGDASVRGTVTYRARIAMPPQSHIEVTIQNISTDDSSSVIVGRQTISDPKGVPVAFNVMYDSGVINDSDAYALQAIIFRDEEIWMSNRETVPVITQDNPTSGVQVVVEPAR
jgi:uncharacterized lipoprotein YbaY